ncbi:MAG: hypothetical protein SWX82_25835 [Cyanobacteriota bacterium]|nr:hypothetical protein [Cyanobacteriota bacterium]
MMETWSSLTDFIALGINFWDIAYLRSSVNSFCSRQYLSAFACQAFSAGQTAIEV